jgi:pimeloyl-ACP methyl ester carboxylesterase
MGAGFGWYRAFAADVADNVRASRGAPATTPLLYLRGSRERGGELGPYADGFRRAGVTRVESALIEGAGHFPQVEATGPTWAAISSFATGRQS